MASCAISHLRQIGFNRYIIFYHIKYRIAVDIFLDEALVFHIDIKHLRNSDIRVQQPLIVVPFRFDFIAEGVVIARLMVDLLQYNLFFLAFDEVGIAAFSLAKQFDDLIFDTVYRKFLHTYPFQ